MDTDLWRTQLPPSSRERIVYKIMETLKRHLPYSGEEGLQELRKIAVRFEQKIYSAALSQSDYLRKISLKMLTMESKSQNTIPNSLPPNPAGNNNRPPDAGVSSWRSIAAQGAEPSAETGGDWKTQLPPDSRQRNVNDIMQMLKRNVPYSGEEGVAELMRIAVRFEEKVFANATSQSEYMRKVWMKMIELNSEPLNTNPNPNTMPPNNPSGRSSNNRAPNVGGVPVLRPNAAQDPQARHLLLTIQQQQMLRQHQNLLQQNNNLRNLRQQNNNYGNLMIPQNNNYMVNNLRQVQQLDQQEEPQ